MCLNSPQPSRYTFRHLPKLLHPCPPPLHFHPFTPISYMLTLEHSLPNLPGSCKTVKTRSSIDGLDKFQAKPLNSQHMHETEPLDPESSTTSGGVEQPCGPPEGLQVPVPVGGGLSVHRGARQQPGSQGHIHHRQGGAPPPPHPLCMRKFCCAAILLGKITPTGCSVGQKALGKGTWKR